LKTVVNWFKKHGMTDVWGDIKKIDNYSTAIVRGIRK
jgi:hypothetical protein